MTRNRNPLVISRRQLLTMLGLGGVVLSQSDPVSMLARSLVDGLIADAQAQGAPPVKNFISILTPGAPISWPFVPLNPNNEAIVTNQSVGNWLLSDNYSPGNQVASVYRSEPVTLGPGRTAYMPPLWNRSIPLSTGGSTSIHSLLNNSCLIRGVDIQADLGHLIGPGKILFPVGGKGSLTGLVGDAAPRPIPVVGFSNGLVNYADPAMQGYRAPNGTSPTLVNSSVNPLSNVLSPFINQDPTVLSQIPKLHSAPVQTAISSAMNELGRFSRSSLPGADTLHRNADNARQLFQVAFGDLENVIYPQLLNKYRALVNSCARSAIPFIVPATGSGGYNLANGLFSDHLSFQFAVTEYLITRGYSSSISMCQGGYAQVAGISSGNDEHDEADRPRSIIAQSFAFRSLAALIYELRRTLIAAGKWEQSVIHVSPEFGRVPRNDGTGSDHAPSATPLWILSGAIQEAILIGNVLTDAFPGSINQGSFGAAAPVMTNGGAKLITNNVTAATTAAILGVTSPVTQAESLVQVDQQGRVTASLAEAPRNI